MHRGAWQLRTVETVTSCVAFFCSAQRALSRQERDVVGMNCVAPEGLYRYGLLRNASKCPRTDLQRRSVPQPTIAYSPISISRRPSGIEVNSLRYIAASNPSM